VVFKKTFNTFRLGVNNIMQVFEQVEAEQRHNSEVQRFKYNYTYTISALINPNTTTPFVLAIEQDADFLFTQITGSCYGPCDANAIPVAQDTSFPMPGVGAGAGFAGRGLTMEISDTGSSRDLTRGAVPVELMLTPAYGLQFHLPYPMKYFCARNSKIKFNFTNRDQVSGARHQIDIAINGYKFSMPLMQKELNPTKQIINSSRSAG
jgi:hypothetical protein